MIEYEFDVKLFAAIRVKAETEKEARSILTSLLDAASVSAGAWPDGSPAVFEASVDGEADLIGEEPVGE